MLLKEIVQISEEMLEYANKNRWDEVQSREGQRQAMLSEYFSKFIPENVSQEEEKILQQVSDLNSKLLDKAEVVKQEFVSEVADVINSTKAVQKYQKHTNI
jgi:gas vesicle protein